MTLKLNFWLELLNLAVLKVTKIKHLTERIRYQLSAFLSWNDTTDICGFKTARDGALNATPVQHHGELRAQKDEFRTTESRRLRMHSGSFWVKCRCTIIRRSLNASNSSTLWPSSSSGNTIGVRETKGRAEEMQKEIWIEKGVCVGVWVLCW